MMRLIYCFTLFAFLVSCEAPPRDKSFRIDELMNMVDYESISDSLSNSIDSSIVKHLRGQMISKKFTTYQDAGFPLMENKTFDLGGEDLVVLEQVRFGDYEVPERYWIRMESKNRQFAAEGYMSSEKVYSKEKELKHFSLEREYYDLHDFDYAAHYQNDDYQVYRLWVAGEIVRESIEFNLIGFLHFYSWDEIDNSYQLDSSLFYAPPGGERRY